MNLLEGHLEESVRASPNFDQASGRSEAIGGGKLLDEFEASRFGIFCWGTLAYLFNEECSGKYYDG